MTTSAPPVAGHRTGRRSASGGATFVKWAPGPAERAYLLREAAVYDLVRARCPATAARLPGDVRWNADAAELEMAAVDATDLRAHVTAGGGLDPTVAAAVGRAVGEFHAEAGDPGDGAPASLWLLNGVGFDRPGPAHLRLLSAGGRKLLERLQRSDALLSSLATLAPPAGDQLVHGDLRWQNILVAPEPAPGVWLVDWELGGAGEHAWDAACVAAAAVSEWLHSIPAIEGVAPGRLATEAAVPLYSLRPGLNMFWSAYRAAVPGSASDAWAVRCAQLAAVRLVHLGFESTVADLGVRSSAVEHLQLAKNILGDPARAGRELLGLA